MVMFIANNRIISKVGADIGRMVVRDKFVYEFFGYDKKTAYQNKYKACKSVDARHRANRLDQKYQSVWKCKVKEC